MIFMITHYNGCGIEWSRFVAKLSLRLTYNPSALLEDWSIYISTNIEPESSEGYCHCIVAIDCFSK